LDVQNLHKESLSQKRIDDARDSLRESLLGDSHSQKDKITKDIFKMLPKDTQEKLLEDLNK